MSLYVEMLRLVQYFSFLGAWQRRALALWCSGVILAERCQLSTVADALLCPEFPSSTALVKRLSRFLHNPRISDERLSQAWVQWVARRFDSPHWVVLVDETKLSNHLSVMMVGLAYRQRAIPLLWRCYRPKHYPPEGQVAMIEELITRLRLWLPETIVLTVQADCGIGTSPNLIRALERLGVMYLLRVQEQTRVRLPSGQILPIARLVTPGKSWCGKAEGFKKAGWLPLYVCVHWEVGLNRPWCLVTNSRWRTPTDYALRSWHEQSFRDLKSFGFQWDTSQVWEPAAAHRLLFVLTLAYTWVLSQASCFTRPERMSPSRSAPRESLFRRGLRWLRQQLRLSPVPRVYLDLHFCPDPPLLC